VRGDPLRRSVEAIARHRAQHLLEDDPALQAGERPAEAVVDPLAEREVAPGLAGEPRVLLRRAQGAAAGSKP
jgi:hypothetical protein